MRRYCRVCISGSYNHLTTVCAGTIAGTTLQERCKAINKSIDDRSRIEELGLSECLGYIRGALDVFSAWKQIEGKSTVPGVRGMCVPDSVSTGQAAKVVMKWLDEHPEKLHFNGETVILMSCREAFPCK